MNGTNIRNPFHIEELQLQMGFFDIAIFRLNRMLAEGAPLSDEAKAELAMLEGMHAKAKHLVAELETLKSFADGIKVSALVVGNPYTINQEGHRLHGERVMLESIRPQLSGAYKTFAIVGIGSVEEVPLDSLVECKEVAEKLPPYHFTLADIGKPFRAVCAGALNGKTVILERLRWPDHNSGSRPQVFVSLEGRPGEIEIPHDALVACE